MLPDLLESYETAKKQASSIDPCEEIFVTNEQWEQIKQKYIEKHKSDQVYVAGNQTFIIKNNLNLYKFINCQEFPRLLCVLDLYSNLKIYERIIDLIAKELNYTGRTDKRTDNIFKDLPLSKNIKLPEQQIDRLKSAIDKVVTDPSDNKKINDFFFTPTEEGRKLNRASDWIESRLLKAAGLVAAAADGRFELIETFRDLNFKFRDTFIKKSYSNAEIENANSTIDISLIKDTINRQTGGINRIYYGAPGTGKSYTVETNSNPETRTTAVFHSDTQNSDFVGSLKPALLDGSITYRFSPGPFAVALKKAWLDPANMHYLVIEELNRAPAASVFGELFLLLDRDSDGNSQYETDFPSEEFALWWEIETGEKGKLKLPSNLSILATMNSADQGVFPLDTAFRRRWDQKYIPIDYKHAPTGKIELQLKKGGSPSNVEWKVFVEKLNQCLVENINDLPEDRLIGPYFLSENDLKNNVEKSVPGKLLIYLWDDLLRHSGRNAIFESSIKTYGDLSKSKENRDVIFSKNFITLFEDEDSNVS